MHDPAPHMPVGAKRNALVAWAKGAVVAMFDDDNLYGGQFLDIMLRHLMDSGARLVSLSGFWGYNHVDGTNGGVADAWEYYRNVGGRGETQVFWKMANEVPGASVETDKGPAPPPFDPDVAQPSGSLLP